MSLSTTKITSRSLHHGGAIQCAKVNKDYDNGLDPQGNDVASH
jgi:hypothetical protein